MIGKIGQNGKRLALQTREGNDIENFQNDFQELTPSILYQTKSMIKRHAPRNTRSSPTPCYNCHGLTFASRRTWIDQSREIQKILGEDKYIRINTKDTLPGDIIVYYGADGDPEHSGIVVSEPKELGIPMVVSKWGALPEFVHWANQCPYSFQKAKFYRIEK